MKKRIFVYLFILIVIPTYIGIITGQQLGENGYKEQQEQYNKKEKFISGIIEDMNNKDNKYTMTIRRKEYNLEDCITTYTDYDEISDIYAKIEINDTIKVYKSEDEIQVNGGTHFDYRYVIKCNNDTIYNSFGTLTLKEHIQRCTIGCSIGFFILLLISVSIFEGCFYGIIEDYIDDFSYNRKQKKKKKKEAKQEKIKELKKKLEEYEKDQNKTNYKCQYCGTKNINKAKYCHNCGLEF